MVQPATGFQVASVHSIEVSAMKLSLSEQRPLACQVLYAIPQFVTKRIGAKVNQPIEPLVLLPYHQRNTRGWLRTKRSDQTQPIFDQSRAQRRVGLSNAYRIAPSRRKIIESRIADAAIIIEVTLKVE
jgi:hypothetical protein